MSLRLPHPGRLRPARPAATAMLLCLLFHATAGAGAPRPELLPLPRPDLDAMEPAVGAQLAEVRAELDALLAEDAGGGPGASPEILAGAFGTVGRTYHAYGLTGLAVPAYENARRLSPAEPRWHYLAGVAAATEGDAAGAAGAWERLLELLPDDAPTLLRLGRLRLDEGRLEAAEQLFRRALDDPGARAAAHHGLGMAAIARGDAPVAIAELSAALDLAPEATRLHHPLARAHLRAGDRAAAEHHLARAGDGPLELPDARIAELAELTRGSGAHLLAGARATVAGDLEAAEAAYRAAVAAAPRSAEARLALAGVLGRRGERAAAVVELREALRLDPGKAWAHYALAGHLAANGAGGEALDHLERAVELAPEVTPFRMALAGALAQQGHLDAARGHYDRVIAREPANAAAHLQLGYTLLQIAPGHAGDAFAAATKLAPDPRTRASALYGQSLLAAAIHADAERIAYLEAARAADDTFVEAHLALGEVLGAAGDYPEAAESFRRAVRLDPGRVRAWLGEAVMLATAEREREALERLEAGLAVHPGSAELVRAKARLLAAATDRALRDGARAVELARRLLAATGAAADAELLATALAEGGRFDEAAEWQRRALAALGEGDGGARARLEASLARYEAGQGPP